MMRRFALAVARFPESVVIAFSIVVTRPESVTIPPESELRLVLVVLRFHDRELIAFSLVSVLPESDVIFPSAVRRRHERDTIFPVAVARYPFVVARLELVVPKFVVSVLILVSCAAFVP